MTTQVPGPGAGPPEHQPPFDPAAARRLRRALGLGHDHVAYGMRAAYGLAVPAAAVADWEKGHARPNRHELDALAGALWCTPADLMGSPTSLHAHRRAHGLPLDDVARHIGMDPATYLSAERTGRWPGTESQATRLAYLLRLPLPDLLDLTGRSEPLARHLRDAATTRWQPQVRPVARLTRLPRRPLERALSTLHEEYQTRTAAARNWGEDPPPDSAAGVTTYLQQVLPRFWELLRN
ncbi:helix-turn-helix transcriptional regulator [Streptomyces sp. B8F3]|uniref:helix-turn-helix domain-containing protein n=1 Tax=unclassified Streptomyces TaxID=2593676 RepID=UPI00325C529A